MSCLCSSLFLSWSPSVVDPSSSCQRMSPSFAFSLSLWDPGDTSRALNLLLCCHSVVLLRAWKSHWMLGISFSPLLSLFPRPRLGTFYGTVQFQVEMHHPCTLTLAPQTQLPVPYSPRCYLGTVLVNTGGNECSSLLKKRFSSFCDGPLSQLLVGAINVCIKIWSQINEQTSHGESDERHSLLPQLWMFFFLLLSLLEEWPFQPLGSFPLPS